MTSIRDLFGEALAVGETFCLAVEERDGTLVAAHPNEASPAAVAVVEDLDRLEEYPPSEPIEVEIVGRFVGNRVVGRVVGDECDEPENIG